jgi:trimeric autotransporter adhesin
MNTLHFMAAVRLTPAKAIACLSLLSAVCTTAKASPGQEVDYGTLLGPRAQMKSAVVRTAASQTAPVPLIYLIGNAASLVAPFSAGQLITIFGPQLGPTPGVGATVTNGVVASSAGGTQVLFDGIAVPILYAGANQVNAIIPCSVAGHASTQVVVNSQGNASAPVTIPLSDAAPGLFTIAGSSQGAFLNQDNSVNGAANPAALGSTVILYATGLGKTSPACSDGQIYTDTLPAPVLPVTATVGNMNATVQYAGQAPGIVSGVAQINIVIPANAPTGPAVPVTIQSGTFSSQTGVTLAIK